jgi:hypothetical protein
MTNKNELADAIDKLIPSLAAIFPAWRQAIKTPDEARMVKREWYMALSEANVTPKEVAQGLSKARKHDSPYLPSCGMFLAWCRSGSELSKNQAWQMACCGSVVKPITDPLVLEAVNRSGGMFNIKNRPERDMRPLFFDHYADVLRERAGGAQFSLPAPEPEPEEEKRTPMSDQEIAAAKQKINDILNGVFDDPQS